MLGTDGLWDIMSNEEVVDFVQRYRNSPTELTCAEALTLEAQERWKARHEEVRRLAVQRACYTLAAVLR